VPLWEAIIELTFKEEFMSKKLALITGGSRGIGKAVAVDLARQGYDLAIIAKSKKTLVETKSEILRLYGNINIDIFPLDIQNTEDVGGAVDEIHKKHQSIDVVFNNAGLLIRGSDDINPKEFDELVNVNIKGVYNILHFVVPILKEQKSGYIFNLASMAGKRGVPGIGAYALTKFGVVGISDTLYYELLKFNIKVTALCPSAIATDMTQDFAISHEEMIETTDIVKAVNFVMSLGDNACVPELLIRCKTYDIGKG